VVKPKVLVIMCSFNGEKYIKEQIMSILNQLAVDLDLMVFDDQSTDDTALIVNNLCKLHNNITLIINKDRSGSAAKNFCNSIKSFLEGIISRYDYIALSDQDDIWLPFKLHFACEELRNNKASLYASNLTLWEQKTNKKSLLRKDYPQREFDFLFEGGSAGCTYVFTSEFAIDFRKKLFGINYKNWNFFSHDWLIYFFARINKIRVVIDSRSEILYRIHSENVHGQMNTNSAKAIKKRLDLLISGWYFKQIESFSQLINPEAKEFKIYKLFTENWFSRLFLLFRFNFKLVRSKRKFLMFTVISLIPRRFIN
jgi:rhamnosyltransferase